MSRQAWIVVIVLVGMVAIATLVGTLILLMRVLRIRKMLGELGIGGKVAFYGALIYAIFPIDLLPDPIYLDDMGVLAGALIYLTRLAQKHRAARAATMPPAPARIPRPPNLQRPGMPRRP
ncbi:MAG TPA: YkvA family protein [Planosporangium sp.]|jgi:uncharacterized membrane protein YkvA (DUF1232 family)|nr:YkvA family protein [Planosporangium sp.]